MLHASHYLQRFTLCCVHLGRHERLQSLRPRRQYQRPAEAAGRWPASYGRTDVQLSSLETQHVQGSKTIKTRELIEHLLNIYYRVYRYRECQCNLILDMKWSENSWNRWTNLYSTLSNILDGPHVTQARHHGAIHTQQDIVLMPGHVQTSSPFSPEKNMLH